MSPEDLRDIIKNFVTRIEKKKRLRILGDSYINFNSESLHVHTCLVVL